MNNSKKITMIMAALAVAVAFAIIAVPAIVKDDSSAAIAPAIDIDGTGLSIDFVSVVNYGDYGSTSNAAMGNYITATFDSERNVFVIEGPLAIQPLGVASESPFYTMWPGNNECPYGIAFNVTGAEVGGIFNVGTGAEKTATEKDNSFQSMLYVSEELYEAGYFGAFSYTPVNGIKTIYYFELKDSSMEIPGTTLSIDFVKEVNYGEPFGAISNAAMGNDVSISYNSFENEFYIIGNLMYQGYDTIGAFYKLWPDNNTHPYGIAFNIEGAEAGDTFSVGTGKEVTVGPEDDGTFQCMLYLTGEDQEKVGFTYNKVEYTFIITSISIDDTGLSIDFAKEVDYGAYGITSNYDMGNDFLVSYEDGIFTFVGDFGPQDLVDPDEDSAFYKLWPTNTDYPYGIVFNIVGAKAGDEFSVGSGAPVVVGPEDDGTFQCMLYLKGTENEKVGFTYNGVEYKFVYAFEADDLLVDFATVNYGEPYGSTSNTDMGNDIAVSYEDGVFEFEGTLAPQSGTTSAFYKLWPTNTTKPYGIAFNVAGAKAGDKFSVGSGAQIVVGELDDGTFQCMLYLDASSFGEVVGFTYTPEGGEAEKYYFDLSATVPSDAVAYNNTNKTYYSSLEDAIAAATKDDIIDIVADCSYVNAIAGATFISKDLTINGNFNTVTMNATLVNITANVTFNDVVFSAVTTNNLFDIRSASAVEIKFNGCTFTGNCTESTMNFIQAGGMSGDLKGPLVLKDCIFDMTGTNINRAVRAVLAGGSVTVEGCTFIGTGDDKDTPVKVSGANYTTKFIASDNFQGQSIEKIFEVYAVGDAFVDAAALMPIDDAVAKIGDVYYLSLEDAIAAAVKGDTIDIIADCTYGTGSEYEFVFISKDLTVNGNFYTVTMNATRANITANVTFNDVVFSAVTTENLFDIRSASAVEIKFNGCTFTGNCTKGTMNFIQAGGMSGDLKGPLVLKDCIFDMTGTNINRAVRAVLAGGSVTVEGCTFIGTGDDKDTPVKVSGTDYTTKLVASNNKQGGKNIFAVGDAFGDAAALMPNDDAVAKIGDVYYLALAKALVAAKSGDNVTLLTDILITSAMTIPVGVTVHVSKDTALTIKEELIVQGGLTVTGVLLVSTGGSIDVQKTLVINSTGSVSGVSGQTFTFTTNKAYIINNGLLDVSATSLIVDRSGSPDNTIENNGTIVGSFPGETKEGTTTEQSLIAQVEAGSDEIVLSKNIILTKNAENEEAVISLQKEEMGTTKDYALTMGEALKITATVVGGDDQAFFLSGLTAGTGGFTMTPGSLNITGAIAQGDIDILGDVGVLRLNAVTISGAVTITAATAAFVYANDVTVTGSGSLTFGDNVTVINAQTITGPGVVSLYDAYFMGSNASSATMTVNNKVIQTEDGVALSFNKLVFSANNYYVFTYADVATIDDVDGNNYNVYQAAYLKPADPDYPTMYALWDDPCWEIEGIGYDDFVGFGLTADKAKNYVVSLAVPVYTITWKIGDATVYTCDAEYGEVPAYGGATPTKASDAEFTYSFVGWNIDKTAAAGVAIAPATEPTTYYAIFYKVAKTYTVTWKDHDGTTLDIDYEVPYGTKVTSIQPANPADYIEGVYTYKFKAWSPSIEEGVTEVVGDITYTATYETQTKAQETIEITNIDVAGTTVTITLADLAADSYWAWASGEAKVSVSYSDFSGDQMLQVARILVVDGKPTVNNLIMPDDDVYQITAEPYALVDGVEVILGSEYKKTLPVTITFDKNGGKSVSPASKDISYPAEKQYGELAVAVPQTGYHFVEWNTKADGTGMKVEATTYLTDAGASTLYAIYAGNVYTIKFDKNNESATGTMADQDFVYDSPAKKLSKNAFVFIGATFQGWATSPSGAVVYTDEQEVVNITTEKETITLYAVWAETEYTVTTPAVGEEVKIKTIAVTPATIHYNDDVTVTVTPWSAGGYVINAGTVKVIETGGTTEITATVTGNVITFKQPDFDVTVSFTMKACQYTLTYQSNYLGGPAAVEDTYTFDTVYNAPSYSDKFGSDTREGYTFDGWATTPSEDVVYEVGDLISVTKDTPLYAHWAATPYTVNVAAFEHGTASIDGGASPHYAGASVTITVTPSTGYTVDADALVVVKTGGSTLVAATVAGNVITITAMPASDVDVTIVMKAKILKVTYDANGGVGAAITPGEHEYGSDVYPVAPPNTYTRTGYTFAAWNTKADGSGTSYAPGDEIGSALPWGDEDHVLYAKWTAIKVNATFTAPDAVPAYADTVVEQTYDAKYVLPVLSPLRTGYTFAGWWTAAEGGTQVTTGDDVKITAATTYYAHWTVHTYTVVFDKNGGTGDAMAGETFNYNEEKALTANSYTRTGYTFAGWATEAMGEVVYADKAVVKNLTAVNAATVTLYAKWNANTYTVAFDKNTGSGETMANQGFTYGAAPVALNANTYTKTGFTFNGWNTQADGKGTAYADKEAVSNLTDEPGATVTLYAQWTANSYTVVFDANGGTTGTMASEAFTYGEEKALTANDFGYEGNEFNGWNTKADGTGTPYTDKQVVSNLTDEAGATVTLYAQWDLEMFKFQYKTSTSAGVLYEKEVEFDGTVVMNFVLSPGQTLSATKDPALAACTVTIDGGKLTVSDIRSNVLVIVTILEA